MGNRPHPYRRQDSAAFEADCDRAFVEETALGAAERAARIREYETSPEQRDWEGHDDDCEAEFISEAGKWSPCRCAEFADTDEIESLEHFERPWA